MENGNKTVELSIKKVVVKDFPKRDFAKELAKDNALCERYMKLVDETFWGKEFETKNTMRTTFIDYIISQRSELFYLESIRTANKVKMSIEDYFKDMYIDYLLMFK